MQSWRRTNAQGYRPATRRDTLLPLLVVVVVAVLCAFTTPVRMCHALPTYATTASCDSRVAELRRTLQSDYRFETIPDPPLELGIHTPCRKFGRGCPDTYVAFLEDLVASLQAARAKEREDGSSGVSGGAEGFVKAPDVPPSVGQEKGSTATPVAEGENAHTTRTATPLTFSPLPQSDAELSVVSASHPPCTLPLPVQISWSYSEYRRLANILVRLRVAEAQLDTQGVRVQELQHRHHIPRAESIVLRDDPTGAVSAEGWAVCDALRQHGAVSAPLALGNGTVDATAAYATWCRFLDLRHRPNSSTEAAHALSRVPAAPLHCLKLDAHRWHALVLLLLDPVLAFLVSWTWSVALPSAVATSVVLWVCVGDGWGEAAEHMILDVPNAAAAAAAAAATKQEEREEEGNKGAADDDHLSPLLPDAQYRASRLAALRFTFVECAVHRSWFTSFLKLRLVLCLLVALDFLWSFAQVLHTTLQPAAVAPAGATSHRLMLSVSVNFVLRVMPTWLRVVVNVYLLVAMQGAVLLMALKGAAGAYADWQDFTASCGAEQEYLLAAVDDVACPEPT